jgi:DNA helicase-2/ATP-dependent DNA helicase PcrA
MNMAARWGMLADPIGVNLQLDDEQRVLNYTIDGLRARLNSQRARARFWRWVAQDPEGFSSDLQAAAIALSDIEDLRYVLDYKRPPYYARFDVLERGKVEPESFYLSELLHVIDTGETGGAQIIHWTSELARAFSTQSVNVRAKELRGEAFLKRRFVFHKSEHKIVQFFDDLRRYVDAAAPKIIGGDSYLAHVLAIAGDRARNIVASIGETQDEIVRLAPKGLLIIDGVPGSGKSQVGQMRIAFLVTNVENEESTRARAEQCLILAPSKALLSYLENVLPSVGVRSVRSATISEWVAGYVGLRELPTTPGVSTRQTALFRRAVEGYVQLLSDVSLFRLLEAEAPRGGNWVLGQDEITAGYQRVMTIPFNRRAFELAEGLTEVVADKVLSAQGRISLTTSPLGRAARQAVRSGERERDDIKRQVREGLREWCRRLLPPLRTEAAYEEMLETAGVSAEMGEADLPALAFMHYLLTGETQNIEHIVVDEGQNVSLLAYHAIRLIAPKASVTIVGHLHQRDPSATGLSDWRDLEQHGYTPAVIKRLLLNYRSTPAIVAVLNALAPKLTPPGEEMQSVRRQAPPVLEIAADSAAAITRLVREVLAAEEYQTAAVLCRTENSADDLFEELRGVVLPQPLSRLDNRLPYRGGIVVGTPWSAGGLEFDLVIGAAVDRESYPDDSHAATDLYMIASRAQNRLAFVYAGNPSPLLKGLPIERIQQVASIRSA